MTIGINFHRSINITGIYLAFGKTFGRLKKGLNSVHKFCMLF